MNHTDWMVPLMPMLRRLAASDATRIATALDAAVMFGALRGVEGIAVGMSAADVERRYHENIAKLEAGG